MASSFLVGPKELREPQPQRSTSATTTTSNAFIDLMVSHFNRPSNSLSQPFQMGYTENMSATYLTSGNPCLDFFFHVVPSTPAESVTQRLQAAWDFNPLTSLKLVCHLRGVRGTGKSDKEGFYAAALWLFKTHPRTIGCNVGSFADFGYFKDLPEILYRILEGADVRTKQKQDWIQRKGKSTGPSFPFTRRGGRGYRFPARAAPNQARKTRRAPSKKVPREVRIEKALQVSRNEKAAASALRKEKYANMAKKVIDRCNHDGDFRFLYNNVAEHFAQRLRSDLESLNSGKLNNISLAAKWCPSTDSSFDRATLLCESIARLIFPKETCPEYESMEEVHYAYRIRDRLRKEVLVPLRKVLELPEVYIGAKQWSSIPYNRVASVAMKFYKEKFIKHDKDRFEKYLDDVKSGKEKITAGALLPHEIIASLDDGGADGGEVAELQWKRMVEDLSKKGKLDNCIAVCDVSGSMSGTPMEVCVALGILVSELSREPWKGKVITFSRNPELHLIQGDSLRSKASFVERMEWHMNTDFQKVFDKILETAVGGKLKAEEMIKRVFVFSDMEFDRASSRSWETDYQVIVKKFTDAGYGSAVPQIVFWNLRDSMATPVTANDKGVALVSGFSKNILKMFLDNDGEIDPVSIMEEAISGPEYQKLVVID